MLEKPLKKKSKNAFRIPAILFSLFLIFFLGVNIYGISHIIGGVTEAVAQMKSAGEEASSWQFEKAEMNLLNAEAEVEQALYGMRFLGWMKWMPFFGDQFEGVEQFFVAGREGIGVLREASEIAQDFQEEFSRDKELIALIQKADDARGFDALPEEVRIRLIRQLRQSSPEIEAMRVKVKLAAKAMEKTRELQLISPLSKIREELSAPMMLLEDAFTLLAPLSQTAPQILGVQDSTQWLLLFLNNHEIRPSGGFMGVYGLLLLKSGSVENLLVEDTYALDRLSENAANRPAPPSAIARYTGVDKWYFRDANWSPSFDHSAQTAITLLREESAVAQRPVPEVHHVIGFTPDFVASILAITGPVTVQGETYTSENVGELLQEEVEFGYEDRGDTFANRKRIVGTLTEELLRRIFQLPANKWPAFASNLLDQFSRKQLFLYSVNPDVQAVFSDFVWSGEVSAGKEDDAFLVVDANMIANKTDLVVDRSISYSIRPFEDRYRAELSIRYSHTSKKTALISDYRTFTRVFVPKGARLISVSGNTDDFVETVEDDLGFSSFGAFIRVPSEGEGELRFIYDLPESISSAVKNGVYQLRVLRQLGSEEIPVSLDLDFGKRVRSAIPAESAQNFGDSSYSFETPLIRDTVFTIQF